MNNLKLKALFTVLITWGVILLFTLSNEQNESEENKISNKSIISVDNGIGNIYYEYTDDLQLIKTYQLAQYQQELKVKRIAAEKLAKEKRIAEEKRKVELAKVAEEKRVADLIAKREAKNKEKLKNNQNQVASISRGQSSNVKTYVYVVTAYTAGVESTGKSKGDKDYGITASGEDVYQGRTLSCPKSIPFGTKIEIEGYGVRICEDRGAHIVNGRLDIYMERLYDAQQFGRQKLQVKIYSK